MIKNCFLPLIIKIAQAGVVLLNINILSGCSEQKKEIIPQKQEWLPSAGDDEFSRIKKRLVEYMEQLDSGSPGMEPYYLDGWNGKNEPKDTITTFPQ